LSTTIAIDTNLLLVVLADEQLRRRNTAGPARLSSLRDVWGQPGGVQPERFQDLRTVVLQANHRIVTQHVIAEVYNLCDRFSVLRDLNTVTDLLAGLGLSEHPCSFADLMNRDDYRKILGDVGVTDAGLIYVAEGKKAVILSENHRDLWRCAHARSVQCYDLRSVDYLLR